MDVNQKVEFYLNTTKTRANGNLMKVLDVNFGTLRGAVLSFSRLSDPTILWLSCLSTATKNGLCLGASY